MFLKSANRAKSARALLLSIGTALGLMLLPLTSLLIVSAAPASQGSVFSGNSQSGVVNSTLSSPLVVVALDADGNAVQNALVEWSIQDHPANATGHAVSSASVMTDAEGHASVTFTLGNMPGTYQVAAMIEGTANPVIFIETAQAAVITQPNFISPANNQVIAHLGTTLTWENPVGTAQYEIRVLPANSDGPAINLIRNVETSYTIEAPVFGTGNYVMLPGMTYTWMIRTTPMGGPVAEGSWGPWTQRTFRTPIQSSSTISLHQFMSGGTVVGSITPTLQWSDSNTELFYYEVQVSADANFDSSIGAPFLYWELRHGGMTTPMNSYTIPGQYPLEHAKNYFWRVRPRVQGDGIAVDWSAAAMFRTP